MWNLDADGVERSTLLDRISYLPNNLIDIILSRLRLRDAVRTSILSTKWRLHWIRTENLLLDHDFYNEVSRGIRDDKMLGPTYMTVVRKVLLSFTGPIRKFVLSVSAIDSIEHTVNLCMLVVSRLGVQDLKLGLGSYHPIPSYLFQCKELKHLSLRGGAPPHRFGELSSLVSLDLSLDVLSGEFLTNLILNCPLIENITISEYVLENVPEWLPAPLEHHVNLKIVYLKLCSLTKIRSVFCHIKSSLNLQTLDILSTQRHRDYLQLQLKYPENKWSLRTVTIAGLIGDETEMVLVEVILSCCPLLEKIYLCTGCFVTSDAEYRIMKDIMRFRRASSQIEIIYSKAK